MEETCIFQVENGHLVDSNFDTSKCATPAAQSNEQIYAMDVHMKGEFTQMNASWKVPKLPPKFANQVVYFWPGFKSTAPEKGLPVLQPVLQYGQTHRAEWHLQSWYVDGNNRPFPVAITGPSIAVSPGDSITSYMSYDQTTSEWTVYAQASTGQNSTLRVSHKKAGNTNYEYAMLVMETIMSAENYCSLYPADNGVEFTGATVNDGQHPKWTTRVQKNDCGQKVLADAGGDDVKMTWTSGSSSITV